MEQLTSAPSPAAPRDPHTGTALEAAADWALFLDVDGTLLNIAETPCGVEVSDHLRDILTRLAPMFGHAVALVSGRPVAELDRLFAPLVLPAAGLHGLERRGIGGTLQAMGNPHWLDPLRAPLADFAAEHPGVLLEDKGRTLALHYRRAPAAEAPARRLVAALTGAEPERFRVIEGKRVVEIKPRMTDKGATVAAFLGEAPFSGRRPVFIGDDVTDEDAFAVVNELGGHSVRVGETPDTKARFRLPDVNAVVAWLESLPAALAATGSATTP